MDPISVMLWGLVLPFGAAGTVVGLSWRIWTKDVAPPAGRSPARWSPALAMIAGIALSHLGLIGYQSPKFDVTQWILLFTAAGAGWGVFATLLPVPEWVRYLVRALMSGGAAYLLLAPLLSQKMPASDAIVLGAAFFAVWTGLDGIATRAAGALFAVVCGVLFAGGSAAVVFSGNASAAMAVSGAGGVLAITFLFALRRPTPGLLRSLVPPLALALVTQWGLGRYYTDVMASWTFVLLALTPLVVAAIGVPLARARRSIVVVAQLVTLLAPLTVAVALTAVRYFAPATTESSSPGRHDGNTGTPNRANPPGRGAAGGDDDYGY